MTLEYARTVSRPPGTGWLTVALACSLLPLGAGVSIFLLWVRTRWSWFPGLGAIPVIGGLLLIPVVLFSVKRYVRACEASDALPRAGWVRMARMLPVLNVVLAILLSWAALHLTSRIKVVVTNKGSVPLHSVVVITEGPEVEMGPVAAGASLERTIRVTTDGGVSFRVVRGGSEVPIPQDVFVDLFHNEGRIHLRVTDTGFVLR